MNEMILKQCQKIFLQWSKVRIEHLEVQEPKGFSSLAYVVKTSLDISPKAILFRSLSAKDNAILDQKREEQLFLFLGEKEIAPKCLYYDQDCRIEEFYEGHSLKRTDIFNDNILKKVANQIYQLHQLKPLGLPKESFFTLLHTKWGGLASQVLTHQRDKFPENEQEMIEDLTKIYHPDMFKKVEKLLPKSELSFCHNDTYHGNIMLLSDQRVKLLDFEFSCMNHKAFDFSNFFAETVMSHGHEKYPYFDIEKPKFKKSDIQKMVDYYFQNSAHRVSLAKHTQLVEEIMSMIKLSDYMYALAAIPLAVNPIQKICFLPYAHRRFHKFLNEIS